MKLENSAGVNRPSPFLSCCTNKSEYLPVTTAFVGGGVGLGAEGGVGLGAEGGSGPSAASTQRILSSPWKSPPSPELKWKRPFPVERKQPCGRVFAHSFLSPALQWTCATLSPEKPAATAASRQSCQLVVIGLYPAGQKHPGTRETFFENDPICMCGAATQTCPFPGIPKVPSHPFSLLPQP